jgi:hypothetical protein
MSHQAIDIRVLSQKGFPVSLLMLHESLPINRINILVSKGLPLRPQKHLRTKTDNEECTYLEIIVEACTHC